MILKYYCLITDGEKFNNLFLLNNKVFFYAAKTEMYCIHFAFLNI